MKRKSLILLSLVMLFLIQWNVFAKGKILVDPKTNIKVNREQLIREVDKSISKGVRYLISKQLPDGSWLQHPAITSLCVMSLGNSAVEDKKTKNAIEKALNFVRKFTQKDGSIWGKGEKDYPNYATSVSLIALAYFNKAQDAKRIKNARKFILGSQFSNVSPDNPFYGGVGYGRSLRPDLSNTQWALEALYLTDYLDREPFSKDRKAGKKADLMWEKARKFLARCQNLKGSNDMVWVTDDPDNEGSFIYFPVKVKGNSQSKAGTVLYKGKETLRGYGSMTYAGLKSMIYAKVDKNDPRVKATVKWVKKHYTFKENPGMKQQGLYYYIHTMGKALSALGEDIIVDDKGIKHNWKLDMIAKLTISQRANGSWFNDTSRWWENMPELVTAYSLLSLELASDRGLAKAIIKRNK